MRKTFPKYLKSICHIGVGNFHKAHQAYILNQLHKTCNKSQQWNIIGLELKPHLKKTIFNHNTSKSHTYHVIEKNDIKHNITPVNCIDTIINNPSHNDIENMNHSELKLITMTITEKGYHHNMLSDNEEITNDIHYINYYLQKHKDTYNYPFTKFTVNNESLCCNYIENKTFQSIYGILFQILYERYIHNSNGISIMSCDNIINNSKLLKSSFFKFIHLTQIDNFRRMKFKNWIQHNVTFPNTMVDRITPYSLNNGDVVCEPYFKWVIEDDFINKNNIILDKPSYEKVDGILFCNSNVLNTHNKIKLEFLNGTHSLIAYICYRSELKTVHDVVSHQSYKKLIYKYMNALLCLYNEDTIQQFNLKSYIDNVIQRFDNKHISDSILRLRQDGGNKLKCIYMQIIQDIKQCLTEKVIDKSIFLDLMTPIKYYFEYIDHVDINELKEDSIGLYMRKTSMDFNQKITYLFKDDEFDDIIHIYFNVNNIKDL